VGEDDGDGGRRGRVVEGDGETYPKTGDRVTVHYTGRLAEGGQRFDSSVEKGQPFSFRLGFGEVIQGWDDGLVNMSLGEKALLRVEARAGYGERGTGHAIPPGADLEFDVELLAVGKLEAPAQAAARAKAARPDMVRVQEQVVAQLSGPAAEAAREAEKVRNIQRAAAAKAADAEATARAAAEEEEVEEFYTEGGASYRAADQATARGGGAASKLSAGFFDGKKATLYPDGSNEGKAPVDDLFGPGEHNAAGSGDRPEPTEPEEQVLTSSSSHHRCHLISS
jgi:FK506-binding protein 1